MERILALTGKRPLLYGNTSFLSSVKSPSDPLALCPLFIAVYGGADPTIPAGWAGKYALWQHTDGRYTGGGYPGYTPGFQHCDRSVYAGTEAELRAAFASIGQPASAAPLAGEDPKPE